MKTKVAACTADTAATVIVDPVCRREVDPKTAPTATYRGKRYFFCSNADKAEFERDPKRYIRFAHSSWGCPSADRQGILK